MMNKFTQWLSIVLVSTVMVALQLSPVQALDIPPGLENAYQQVLSQWANPRLPSHLPFSVTAAEASASATHYLVTIDINDVQTVSIAAGDASKRIDTMASDAVQSIALSNQITGYFLPAGDTDEAPPELSFLIGDINYYVGGWVSPDDLIAIANSMIETP